METYRGPFDILDTLKWMGTVTGFFIVAGLIWGIFVLVLSTISLLAIPSLIPEAKPFIYLSIFGVVLVLLNSTFSHEEKIRYATFFEQLSEMNLKDTYVYAGTLFMVVIFAVSFLVAVVGLSAYIVAFYLDHIWIALAIAMLFPSADSRIGRTIGWNVAVFGGLFGLGIMILFSTILSVSRDIPKSAASDIRQSLYSV